MRIGIVGGSGLLDANLFPDTKTRIVSTPYGSVRVLMDENICFIQRHGRGMPPHQINHKANIYALKKMRIKYVIATSSVGSLKKRIKPGDLVIIDDYIQFSNIMTFYDKSMKFTAPELSGKLRSILIQSARKLRINFHGKGTYIQTAGPRFETRAEIRMMKQFADVVGMTVANEATLAKELDVEYACVCTADNYANGISNQTISWDTVRKKQQESIIKVKRLLLEALPAVGKLR